MLDRVPAPSESLLADMDTTLLRPTGGMRLLRASVIRAFGQDAIRAWAQLRGRYLLPTVELVEWLAERIEPERTLEICAGMGDLGLALGVRTTDSYLQQHPTVALHVALQGAAPTAPPRYVERLGAIEAVRKYKPHTVIGAWVTQVYQAGDEVTGCGSSIYGVDEGHLLNLCRRYILIGNVNTHAAKRILGDYSLYTTHAPPGLVTRARAPDLDTVWIWDSKGER